MPWLAGGIVGLLLVALVWFNGLVRLRVKTRDGFAGIDVQLKRRHDLVPGIVSVVKAYARHERETLEEVTRRRGEAQAASAVPDVEAREAGLGDALGRLLVLVEDYPELKADASFRRLHDDLVEVEDHLQYARRYYNATVRDYNTRLQQFPGSVLGPLFGFREADYFRLED